VAAEQTVIQRGAAAIAFIVFVAVAVNMELAIIGDVIVSEDAFFAGSALENSAQRSEMYAVTFRAFLCSPDRRRIGSSRSISISVTSLIAML